MPTESFIVHSDDTTPGTHVLAIGVGSYPCLPGGDANRLIGNHEGMAQLSSPPVSARELARWFITTFNNPQRPLASVSLLVSESAPAPFVNPATGQSYTVCPATIDNITKAIEEWFGRCDGNQDNLPVFFFCGHGLAQGSLLALLSESFGDKPTNQLDGAIDFLQLHNGMRSCAARQQLFLIDACRTEASAMRYLEGYAGRVVLQRTRKAAWTESPVFYSTLMGLPAYGRGELPSHFTEALLLSLDGAASDDPEGDWRVNTNLLHRALSIQMNRKIEAGMATAQISIADYLTLFDLHWIAGKPRVPVFVSCAPEQAAGQGALHYAVSGSGVATMAPAPARNTWELVLDSDEYDFEARFSPPSPYRTARKEKYLVRPPYRKVPPLEVK